MKHPEVVRIGDNIFRPNSFRKILNFWNSPGVNLKRMRPCVRPWKKGHERLSEIYKPQMKFIGGVRVA